MRLSIVWMMLSGRVLCWVMNKDSVFWYDEMTVMTIEHDSYQL